MDSQDCLAHYPFVVVRARCRSGASIGLGRTGKASGHIWARQRGASWSFDDLCDFIPRADSSFAFRVAECPAKRRFGVAALDCDLRCVIINRRQNVCHAGPIGVPILAAP